MRRLAGVIVDIMKSINIKQLRLSDHLIEYQKQDDQEYLEMDTHNKKKKW